MTLDMKRVKTNRQIGMDTSNWRTAQGGTGAVGDSSMESGDWRDHLLADSRQRIVHKILDTLKRHLPFCGHEGQQELKQIAVRFEEKIYNAATSQSDYLRKISLKMLTMETRSQNPMPDAMQSNSVATIVNPSDSGSQVMQQMNNQGQHLIPTISGPPQSTITDVSGQNSSLHNIQNMSGVQQNHVGNATGHGVLPNKNL